MFSKACEYGIRAAIHIAEQSMLDKKVSLKQVAKAIASPEAYTSKILQQLSRKNIICSEKGPTGGFLMDKQQLEKVRLSNIVLAIDGNNLYKRCGLGLKNCNSEQPCPVHYKYKPIREGLIEMLDSTSVKALALGLKRGMTFLKQ